MPRGEENQEGSWLQWLRDLVERRGATFWQQPAFPQLPIPHSIPEPMRRIPFSWDYWDHAQDTDQTQFQRAKNKSFVSTMPVNWSCSTDYRKQAEPSSPWEASQERKRMPHWWWSGNFTATSNLPHIASQAILLPLCSHWQEMSMLFPVPTPHSEQNLRIAGASCELQSHHPFATLLAPSLNEPFAPNTGYTANGRERVQQRNNWKPYSLGSQNKGSRLTVAVVSGNLLELQSQMGWIKNSWDPFHRRKCMPGAVGLAKNPQWRTPYASQVNLQLCFC